MCILAIHETERVFQDLFYFIYHVQKLYQPVVTPEEIRPQPSQGKDFMGRTTVPRKHCLPYWLAVNV